jgi:hypothetical protein
LGAEPDFGGNCEGFAWVAAGDLEGRTAPALEAFAGLPSFETRAAGAIRLGALSGLAGFAGLAGLAGFASLAGFAGLAGLAGFAGFAADLAGRDGRVVTRVRSAFFGFGFGFAATLARDAAAFAGALAVLDFPRSVRSAPAMGESDASKNHAEGQTM